MNTRASTTTNVLLVLDIVSTSHTSCHMCAAVADNTATDAKYKGCSGYSQHLVNIKTVSTDIA